MLLSDKYCQRKIGKVEDLIINKELIQLLWLQGVLSWKTPSPDQSTSHKDQKDLHKGHQVIATDWV